VVGKALRDIDFPPECVLIAILRKGVLIIPHGDTVLQAIDEVIALVHASRLANLAALLSRAQ
jgi:trk system potassium uptake protein TrkA